LASANAIIQRAKGSVQSGVYSSLSDKIDEIYRNDDVKAIAQAAEEGDKSAFEILDKTGMYIGIGIATLINILNPSMVILGGGITRSGEVLLSSINQTVRKQALGIISRTVSIQKSQIKEYAGVIGGATAVFDKIFASVK